MGGTWNKKETKKGRWVTRLRGTLKNVDGQWGKMTWYWEPLFHREGRGVQRPMIVHLFFVFYIYGKT